MARTSVIFSIAFTALIMLSISHMVLGIRKLTQLGPVEVNLHPLITVKRGGQDQSNLPEGQVNRGGTVDSTVLNGLVVVKDGGGVVADLKKCQVTQGPKHEHINIANGTVTVERSSVVAVDLEKGHVTADVKTEVNIPGVANVNIGVTKSLP